MKVEPTEEGQASDLPPGITVKVSQAFPNGLPELTQNMLKGLHILPGLGIPCYHSDGAGGGGWGEGHLGSIAEPATIVIQWYVMDG